MVINGGTLTPYQYLHLTNLTLTDGATVAYQGADTDGMRLNFSNRNGTITSSGTTSIASRILNSSTLTFDVDSGTLALSKEVNTTAGNSVVKTGAGSLTTSNWLNTNVTIQEGDITLTGGFGDGKRFNGTVTVEAGAKLICAAHDSLGYGGSTTNIYLNGGTLENSVGNETLNNTNIYFKGGTVTSTVAGATLDILNDGVNFYSQAKADATAANPTINVVDSSINLRSNGPFEIDTEANSVLQIPQAIVQGSGAGAITKSGAGTLTLTGANTYRGATTVTGGTLIAGSATALGNTSSLTVAQGATFVPYDGNTSVTRYSSAGTQDATLAVNWEDPDNFLSITNALSTGGDLTLADSFAFKITSTPGLESIFPDWEVVSNYLKDKDVSLLELTSDLTTDPEAVRNTISVDTYQPLFDSASGAFLYALWNPDGGAAGKGSYDLQVGVPEPSTWALLVLGAFGIMGLRRRKRQF